MIKLRVEQHHKCLGCGTGLVVDFFDKSIERQTCPWCGVECKVDRCANDDELREYVLRSVEAIEEKANGKIPV